MAQRTLILTSSKAHLGWVAGILDGEGCISIYKTVFNGYERWTLRVDVRMTDKRTIEALRKITGVGVGGTSEIIKATHNRKSIFRWLVVDSRAEMVLKKCLPVMVTKKRQAEIALVFMKSRHSWRGGNGRPTPLRIRTEREQLRQTMHLLNHKGPERKLEEKGGNSSR